MINYIVSTVTDVLAKDGIEVNFVRNQKLSVVQFEPVFGIEVNGKNHGLLFRSADIEPGNVGEVITTLLIHASTLAESETVTQ